MTLQGSKPCNVTFCVLKALGLFSPPANEVRVKVIFWPLSVGSQGALPRGGVCLQGWGSASSGGLPPGGFGKTPLPETRKAGGTHLTRMLSCVYELIYRFDKQSQRAYPHWVGERHGSLIHMWIHKAHATRWPSWPAAFVRWHALTDWGNVNNGTNASVN